MINPNDVSAIEAEVQRRQVLAQAQYIRNDYKTGQRAIWQKTLGLKVTDLIEFDDKAGEPIVLQIYGDTKWRDVPEGGKVVCQAYFLSVKTTKIFFLEGVFRQGRLYDISGELMIPRLQAGSFTVL